MRQRFLSRYRQDGEQGGAILELAIIGPTFILFIVGVVDLGRILMHHLVLTQIAYEGVRIASSLPSLGITGNTEVGSEYTAANANPVYTVNPVPLQHNLLHERVRMLFNIHRNEGDLQIVESNAKRTRFGSLYPQPGADVRIEICTNYDGLFPAFFDTIRICAEAVGPYLDS